MKLQDCSCGGIPQVTYRIDHRNEFIVSCPICGSSTSVFDNLKDAVNEWNQLLASQRRLVVETAR